MSSAYRIGSEIAQRTRFEKTHPREAQQDGKKLTSIVFNPDDVAHVASLYWKLIPCDTITQFLREFMPAGIHNPRDIARDPEKFPPVFMSSPGPEIGVQGCFLPVDKGEGNRDPLYIPAIDRARDIANRYAKFGFFVPANGDHPTKEECAEALKKLENTYNRWIEMGDEAWRKTGRVKDVITTARIAAEFFGLKREWNDRVGEQGVCEYCKRSVPTDMAKCPHCSAILDWKKARKGGMVSKAEYDEHMAEEAAESEPARRGPGRPPKPRDEVEL